MSNALSPIKHIVVLMLENRSFDNVLGKTFEPEVKRVNRFYPSSKLDFTVPIQAFNIPGRNFLSASVPTPDPGEYFQYMNQQIFGLRDPLPVNSETPTECGPLGPMGGFVQNYQQALGDHDYPKVMLPTIMNMYSKEQFPVSTALGEAFAVLDTYHASAPCQTMPNRCFATMGTAQGYVNNNTYTDSYANGKSNALYFGPTIFNHIDDAEDADWRVYFGDFPLTLTMFDTWSGLGLDKFHFFDQFQKDIDNNSLPAYSWIEPAYQLFPTDNHPPHDINLGEYLLEKVYNALRGNEEIWESTLLVVTYDEHGGCYDHVLPPAAVPDGDNPQFAFDRYGVRVPTLLISPYINAGTIGTPGASADNAPVYDHTSILSTVRKCFDIDAPPLSEREAKANDFSAFLTLSESELNNGPASVSVGISEEELKQQAILETLSGLGQLWWDAQHKIPTSPEAIATAVRAGKPPTLKSAPDGSKVSDAEKIADIEASIKNLFGRVPVGLMEYK